MSHRRTTDAIVPPDLVYDGDEATQPTPRTLLDLELKAAQSRSFRDQLVTRGIVLRGLAQVRKQIVELEARSGESEDDLRDAERLVALMGREVELLERAHNLGIFGPGAFTRVAPEPEPRDPHLVHSTAPSPGLPTEVRHPDPTRHLLTMTPSNSVASPDDPPSHGSRTFDLLGNAGEGEGEHEHAANDEGDATTPRWDDVDHVPTDLVGREGTASRPPGLLPARRKRDHEPYLTTLGRRMLRAADALFGKDTPDSKPDAKPSEKP
ncbi:MAG: hypothetical protein AAGA48_28730 [Myxococcota bacterium]